jgi:HAD superfamily hydrolase (TIGR01509 family)
MPITTHTFYADAVLFDMDGTLTDSIAAVEAAWGKVANDINQDPAYVIAATHGKRAVDNLAMFKPHIKPHEMDAEVQAFEESILFFADAHRLHGPGSSSSSPSSLTPYTPYSVTPAVELESGSTTPDLTPGSSAPSSRASSFSLSSTSRRPSFATRLSNMLSMSAVPESSEASVHSSYDITAFEDPIMEESHIDILDTEMITKEKSIVQQHQLEAWQLEAAAVDRSVQILPGVKRMMDSIPQGRYAVATSGAKTYAYGCMTRVGITPPPITITASDPRVLRGKPHPDPFLLAASLLGFPATRCVVFEDSPSGIRAGVASGAVVIAVCTSHEREKIAGCGATWVVRDMECVKCRWEEREGRLRFDVEVEEV